MLRRRPQGSRLYRMSESGRNPTLGALFLLLILAPGCHATPRPDTGCDCREGQACDGDGTCRLVCTGADDCGECQACSGGLCVEESDCSGLGIDDCEDA